MPRGEAAAGTGSELQLGSSPSLLPQGYRETTKPCLVKEFARALILSVKPCEPAAPRPVPCAGLPLSRVRGSPRAAATAMSSWGGSEGGAMLAGQCAVHGDVGRAGRGAQPLFQEHPWSKGVVLIISRRDGSVFVLQEPQHPAIARGDTWQLHWPRLVLM